MKLLLTNDDGIESPGLEALVRSASGLGESLIAAPSRCWSSCGHQVTAHQPIRVREQQAGRFVVEGTPADCVRAALHELLPDLGWVLSGINLGGNLGTDVYLSGTVAAVREAVLHGKTGIAVSHYRKRGMEFDWERATGWLTPVLRELLARPAELGAFWNVNLPNLRPDEPEPKVVYCRLDPMPLPLSYRREGESLVYDGNYHQRRRQPGADVDVCFSGDIAVTRLTL